MLLLFLCKRRLRARQLRRPSPGFRQPLLRARQHLRDHAIPTLRVCQGRSGVRQFLTYRGQRFLRVTDFALGTGDLRLQACRRRSRLR